MEHGTRVGLGAIDRLVLLGAWLVSCAAVYGLGFYTGSHTQDRPAGEEDRVVRLPVTGEPPPVGQRPKSGDDLTFWNALESSGPRIKPGDDIPARPAPAAAPAPRPKASAAGTDRVGAPSARKTAKPATRAPGRKRSAAPAPAGTRGVKASSRPAPTAAKASAPSSGVKRPAAPAKAAPRTQPLATASAPKPGVPAPAPRRAVPPRKAPAPAREAGAAAD